MPSYLSKKYYNNFFFIQLYTFAKHKDITGTFNLKISYLTPISCTLCKLSHVYRLYVIGDTPLHECVRHNLLECVTELLKHGSDVNHMNANGYSALHLAVHNRETFSFEMVRTLVTCGFGVDVNLPDSTGNGHSVSVSLRLIMMINPYMIQTYTYT